MNHSGLLVGKMNPNLTQMKKSSDLFVECLENEGVEYIFGIPGEENLDFLESLRKSKKIRLILTRHEQAAAFMAATYGRLTGKAGVALSTLGPGATNFCTGVSYAQLGGMPLVVLTGQKPIRSSKQGQFQILDVVEMMRPITKFTKQIVDGGLIPSLVRESFRRAEEERPGAVHLELPEDIAREEVEAEPFEKYEVRLPAPNIDEINKAVEMIKSAKHPLVLVGAGANRKHIAKALVAFFQKTGLPFFNTQMGKGILPTVHPLYLGTAALSDGDFIHCAIKKSDLIINIGHDIIEKPPFFMYQGGQKVIHINFCSAQVDNVYFPQLEVVGDISQTLDHLASQLRAQENWDFEYFFTVRDRLKKHIWKKAEDPNFPVIPQRFVADVRKAMSEDGIIALDNGIYKLWFARNYRAFQQNTILLDNALATMGAGLPSAMGAKIVYPEKKVMAICGDGGFMMNSQEIETAVRLKMDLVILVLNDNAFGMIKWKQNGMNFPDFGLDYGNPDFVKYAESYGANGYRIEKTDDFLPLLTKCLDTKGVHLIELPVDYSENIKVLTQELKKLTCSF